MARHRTMWELGAQTFPLYPTTPTIQDPIEELLQSAKRQNQNVNLRVNHLPPEALANYRHAKVDPISTAIGKGAIQGLAWAGQQIWRPANAVLNAYEQSQARNLENYPARQEALKNMGLGEALLSGFKNMGQELGHMGKDLWDGFSLQKQASTARILDRGMNADWKTGEYDPNSAQSIGNFSPVKFLMGDDTPYSPTGTDSGKSLIREGNLFDIAGFFGDMYAGNVAAAALMPRIGPTRVDAPTQRVAANAPRTFKPQNPVAVNNPIDEIIEAATKTQRTKPNFKTVNEYRNWLINEARYPFPDDVLRMGPREVRNMVKKVRQSTPLDEYINMEIAKRGFQGVDDYLAQASRSGGDVLRNSAGVRNLAQRGIAPGVANAPQFVNVPVGPPTYRNLLQIGGFTPFKGAQIKALDAASQMGKDWLSKAPGLEKFLTNISNRVESTRTAGSGQIGEIVQQTTQGHRTNVHNYQQRLNQALKSAGIDRGSVTEAEGVAAYFSSLFGQNIDDPNFLKVISKELDIPMSELSNVSRLKPLQEFVEMELAGFRELGEARGLFQGIDDYGMPIFSKKGTPAPNTAQTLDGRLAQEMGGLRSIQKHRTEFNPENWAEWLSTNKNRIDNTNIFDAMQRYVGTHSNLQRRDNLIEMLMRTGPEGRELVKKGTAGTPPPGYEDLANIFEAAPGLGFEKNRYFIRSDAAPRLHEQLYGHAAAGLFDPLKQFNDMWASTVTTLNPKFHIRNLTDDTARAMGFSGTTAKDMIQGFKGMGDDIIKGVDIQDWVKNAAGQWEFRPGAFSKMDITAREAGALADAMGVTMARMGDMRAAGPIDLLRKASDSVTSGIRRGNFVGQMKQTGHSKAAADFVNKVMINYRDLTPFQRDVLRPLMPFSTFNFKNPQAAMTQLMNRPMRVYQWQQLQNAAAGGDPSVYEDLPSWMDGQPVLAWNDPNTGMRQVLDTGLSQGNLTDLAQMETWNRMPGPIIQAAIGAMRGRDAFNRDIEGMKNIDDNTLAKIIFGITGHAQEGPDGTFVDAMPKFLFDTLAGGASNFAKGIGNVAAGEGSKWYSMMREYDPRQLQAWQLNDETRAMQDALNALRAMGYAVPTVNEIQSMYSRPSVPIKAPFGKPRF